MDGKLVDLANSIGDTTSDYEDKLMESVILYFGDYQGHITIDKACGTIIAPKASVTINGTSAGRLIAKTIDNGSGEWHFHNHHLPVTFNNGFKVNLSAVKKIKDGNKTYDPSREQQFTFTLSRKKVDSEGNYSWEQIETVKNNGSKINFADVLINSVDSEYAWKKTSDGKAIFTFRIDEQNDGGAYQNDNSIYLIHYILKEEETTAGNGDKTKSIVYALDNVKYGVVQKFSSEEEFDNIVYGDDLAPKYDARYSYNASKMGGIIFTNTVVDNKFTLQFYKNIDGIPAPANDSSYMFELKVWTKGQGDDGQDHNGRWTAYSWHNNDGNSVKFDVDINNTKNVWDYNGKKLYDAIPDDYTVPGEADTKYLVFRVQEIIPGKGDTSTNRVDSTGSSREIQPDEYAKPYTYYDHNIFYYAKLKINKAGNIVDSDKITYYQFLGDGSNTGLLELESQKKVSDFTSKQSDMIFENWTTTHIKITKTWKGSSAKASKVYVYLKGTTDSGKLVYGKIITLTGKEDSISVSVNNAKHRVYYQTNKKVDWNNSADPLGVSTYYMGGQQRAENGSYIWEYDNEWPELAHGNTHERDKSSQSGGIDNLYMYTKNHELIIYTVEEIDPYAHGNKKATDVVSNTKNKFECNDYYDGYKGDYVDPKYLVAEGGVTTTHVDKNGNDTGSYLVHYDRYDTFNPGTSFVITNSRDMVLPETGGRGTRTYAMFGTGALIAAALASASILISRRKKK
ncbi:MAG: LPXTG cell wall anchor domain-containing protein [Catonella sp.]|nr:LPXTG cell wall anchor domain-containing protein [Catonella sp.]